MGRVPATEEAEAEDEDDKGEGEGRGRHRTARHETAAGRGTIINVFDDGNACQVRWDATGLVAVYETGRNGRFTLQAWGTDTQLRNHWLALPAHVRASLHDDLSRTRILTTFLADYNLLAPHR